MRATAGSFVTAHGQTCRTNHSHFQAAQQLLPSLKATGYFFLTKAGKHIFSIMWLCEIHTLRVNQNKPVQASKVTMNLHWASEDVMQLMLSSLISTCLSISLISRISHKAPSISHLYLKLVIPLWKGLSAGSYHSAYHISAFTLCKSQDCVMGGRKKHGLQLLENIKIQLSQALALSSFCDWALCKCLDLFFEI